MKSKLSWVFPATAALAAAILAGCATDPAAQARHRQHHPDAAQSQGRMGMGMGAGPMGRGMMMSDAEMKSMCEMHEKMMGTMTPEERKSMMTEHMKKMSPETMKKHMEMMQYEMRMMQEHMGAQTPAK